MARGGGYPDIEDINHKNNYSYDAIGNLVKDSSEHIKNIAWTVSGKIRKIERETGINLPDLEFLYDAAGLPTKACFSHASVGNRIAKIVKPMGTTANNGNGDVSTEWIYTYYTRDAQVEPQAKSRPKRREEYHGGLQQTGRWRRGAAHSPERVKFVWQFPPRGASM